MCEGTLLSVESRRPPGGGEEACEPRLLRFGAVQVTDGLVRDWWSSEWWIDGLRDGSMTEGGVPAV